MYNIVQLHLLTVLLGYIVCFHNWCTIICGCAVFIVVLCINVLYVMIVPTMNLAPDWHSGFSPVSKLSLLGSLFLRLLGFG